MSFHQGTVSLLGKPNVGKSTLLNRLLTKKLSITSKKPQTTRREMLGYDQSDSYLAMYVDTPGFQTKHKNALNKWLNRRAMMYPALSDLVLFVIDNRSLNKDDNVILEYVRASSAEVVCLINKVDLLTDEQCLSMLKELSDLETFSDIIPISAKDSSKVISALKKIIMPKLPQAEKNNIQYTNDPIPGLFIPEMIREKVFRFMDAEIPYQSTVSLEHIEQDPACWKVFAKIIVASESQKGMMIGAHGSKIKQIGIEARKVLEKHCNQKIFLSLSVEVHKLWFDDKRFIEGSLHAMSP